MIWSLRWVWACHCSDWYANDGVVLVSLGRPNGNNCHEWDCSWKRLYKVKKDAAKWGATIVWRDC